MAKFMCINQTILKLASIAFLTAMLFAGITVFNSPVAHAAPAVQTGQHTVTSSSGHLSPLVPDSCGGYVSIYYNNGNSCYAVYVFGYNGLTFNLYNVSSIISNTYCVGYGSWLRAYNGGAGFYSYFDAAGFYSGLQPPYNFMTQIDLINGCSS